MSIDPIFAVFVTGIIVGAVLTCLVIFLKRPAPRHDDIIDALGMYAYMKAGSSVRKGEALKLWDDGLVYPVGYESFRRDATDD